MTTAATAPTTTAAAAAVTAAMFTPVTTVVTMTASVTDIEIQTQRKVGGRLKGKTKEAERKKALNMRLAKRK